MADDEKLKTNPCGSGEPQSPKTSLDVSNPDILAQRVSKKTNDKSTRPRETINDNLTFDQRYGPKNFTLYYSIKSTNGANLTKLNMFKVDKEIKTLIGTYEKISEDYANKCWTIEVTSERQGDKLKTMKQLISEPVTVTPHERYNSSQGVITCSLLKGCSDEDIVEGLAEHGVTACRRIIKNPKSDKPEPTTTLILTFNAASPPDRITIRTGLVERVRPYIPLPRRCFKCQKYGHSGAKCRKLVPVCTRCGGDVGEGHDPATCQLPISCVHCNEPHYVTSKTCPRYLMEKEVLTIKTKEHLTFSEARAKAILNIQPHASYASVVAKPTQTPNIPLNSKTTTDDNNNHQTHAPPSASTSFNKKRPLHGGNSPPPPPPDKSIRSSGKRSKVTAIAEPPPPDPPDNISETSMEYENEMILTPTRRNSLPGAITHAPGRENDILNSLRKTSREKKAKDRLRKLDQKKLLKEGTIQLGNRTVTNKDL